MTPVPRHQCLIYDGSPSRNLAALAAIIRNKLNLNHRCLYLNSPPMVAGMGSHLASIGVDVAAESEKGSLQLSAAQDHLVDGIRFDIDSMMRTLEDALDQALREGYVGLWATGDMSWEFGPEKDFSRLVEYERRLEGLFRKRPELSGICQYHAETLPRAILRKGLLVHPGLFISETLSLINPHYLRHEGIRPDTEPNLDRVIHRLMRFEIVN